MWIWIIGEGGWGILKTLFPLIGFFCDLGVMVADSERKYNVTANCHVTPFKLKRFFNLLNLF
jgi:hypothetical protein